MPVIHTSKGRWLAAWLGGAAIGVGNGVAREATLAKHMPAARASQLSALTGILAFAAYFRVLERRWPLRDGAEAAQVGAVWLAMTVCFEFGFGRLVAKKPWEELLRDYDLRRGRLWPLVLASIAVGPELARRSAAP